MASNSTRKLWAAHLAKGGHDSSARKQQASMTLGKAFRGRVLGIDPSLRGSGFAVLDYSANKSSVPHAERLLALPPCAGYPFSNTRPYG